MAATNTNTEYVPGICNINRSEIAYRRKAGYLGLAGWIVISMVLVGLNLNRWFRLITFVPAFIAAIGFLQAKNKFCVAYGANGRQNASEASPTALAVEDEEARHKDKLRARSMNLQAAFVAAIVTLLIFSIPVR